MRKTLRQSTSLFLKIDLVSVVLIDESVTRHGIVGGQKATPNIIMFDIVVAATIIAGIVVLVMGNFLAFVRKGD